MNDESVALTAGITMMRKLVASFLFLGLLPLVAEAGMEDRVIYVYSCGDDVGIQMENAGWVVVRQADVGAKRVDRVMAIAMMTMATGTRTGYFNEGAPLSGWCGIPNVKPITVLGVLNQ